MPPEHDEAGRIDSVPPVTFDAATAALVRLSARITAGSEESVREGLAECADAGVADQWIEELVLQSYLFAGFPRALNAAREWRRLSEVGEPGVRRKRGVRGEEERRGVRGEAAEEETYAHSFEWRMRGAETCEVVYGASYDKLRGNIRRLHPLLDEWMIVEGYGKVLSRPGLDLARRELCIVAACAAAAQDRQLQSHLIGARNAGVADDVIGAALGVLRDLVPDDAMTRARLLWERVKGK
ncbi:MAG: carboxymuconolactone decarboxylase family protein [Gemmatimonadetes bacterium]|nr:carboxymuconolactone decarboxylase family protein [Gemmatimonadota bacterium]